MLHEVESLSGVVEAAVRHAAAVRRMQAHFHERGQAAWEHYQATGASTFAEAVLPKLQTKLDVRRLQLSHQR